MTTSQPQKVAIFLKENNGKEFTANEISRAIIAAYPEEYEVKKNKSNFTQEKLINQVASEIGSSKSSLSKLSISWNDFQKPRRYFYQNQTEGEISHIENHTTTTIASVSKQEFKEIELYAPLMDFLSMELGLFCMRIRENTSTNSLGHGANKWIHPDIVAMQPLDKGWNKEVKECLRESGSSNVRLWSFEVKKALTLSNLRESFFQTVSNSSWANEGYLVSTSFAGNVEPELRILSSLHGIGIIKLNPHEPTDSEILLPSKRRNDVDWQSVNRIAKENNDFKSFIKNVYTYFKTGNLELKSWNQ